MKKFFYLLAASLLFSFLIISCSSDVAETKEVSFTIPNAFAQVIESRLSSRSAAPDDLNDYSLKIQLTAAGSVYEQKASLNTDNSNVNVTFRNVVVGSSATLKVWLLYKSDEIIATGSSDPFIVKESGNAVKITLKFEEGKGFKQNGGGNDILIYFYNNGTYTYKKGSDVTIEDATDKFAYDSDGNVWALKGNENTGLRIVTDKEGSRNTDYSIVSEEQLSGGYGITIDQTNDTLYTFFGNNNSSESSFVNYYTRTAKLYKYSGFIQNPGNAPSHEMYNITYTDDQCKGFWGQYGDTVYYRHLSMVVYNDVLYDLIIENSNYKICLIKSSLESGNLVDTTMLCSGFKASGFKSSPSEEKFCDITDMIIDDEYIYILYKNVILRPDHSGNAEVCQRGGLLRVKLDSGECTDSDFLGWNDNVNITTIDCTSADENYVLCTNVGQKLGYNDVDLTEYYIVTGAEIAAKPDGSDCFQNTPWDLIVPRYSKEVDPDTYVFLNPQKFIAIKPKKLVISDSGIAFYTTTEGLWAYKNVNRIVTVSLENFLIESVEEADVTYTEKQTLPLVFCGSGMKTTLDTDEGVGGYFDEHGDGYGTIPSASDFYRYLGIPNID